MVKCDPAAIRGCGVSGQRKRPAHPPAENTHLLEPLEKRVLLTAVFVATTTDLHNIQEGPLAKAGGNLANLYLDYRSAQRAGTLQTFETKAAAQSSSSGSLLDVVGDTVGVTLVGVGNLTTFEQSMEALGFTLQSITPSDNAIAGYLPITMLSQVSQSSDVLHITPFSKPQTFQEGEAPNQADQAMQAIGARMTYSLTGAGVKVGVISDSVSQYGGGLPSSVATGDLPNNVTVIQDGQPGDTDEGRAILEQIYDLAPGAKLYFDTAGDTQQSMATAIAALKAAGCNVIIDDIGFDDEPFFQPGVIDEAIDTAVTAGVTYVTAAGNSGTAGFEQAATFVPATDGSGDELINFNKGGTAATKMTITINSDDDTADELTLEWDDKFDGVTGDVTADLNFDLYSADGSTLLYSSTDNTFATGEPVQQIGDVLPGTYQVEIEAVNTPTADLPGYYEFVGGENFTSITTQYTGMHTTIYGHSAFSDAISVGAVAFNNAPAFSSATPIPTEDFSGAGPAIEARDANGNLLATAKIVDVPDVSGTDGNNTSFFSPGDITPSDPTTYPQFFGTSSSSGNTAGVVALLLQSDPTATPAEILSALETTAIPVNGQVKGTYNDTGGYGLIDADAAVAALNSSSTGGGGSGGGGSGGGTTAVPPTVTIVPVSPDPATAPVATIDIDFNELVSGFSLGDLTLTLNGGSNLLTTSQGLLTTNDQDYVLENLSTLTATAGTYTLTLSATASEITGTGGLSLASGASTTFVVEPAATISDVPTHVTASAQSGTSVTLNFEEPNATGLDGFVVKRSINSSFTGKVATFNLSSTTGQFTDTGLAPNTVYYYQVAAVNEYGTSAYGHAATVITPAAGEEILDTNSSAGVTVTGSWTATTAVGGYEGANYLQDDDDGKGTKSVKYRPDLISAGEYDIYASWVSAPGEATNVPFDIFSKTGVLLQTVRVNERSTGGDGWVLLGEFDLHSSTASLVRIRNAGTNGEVIANSIKFLPAGDIERTDATFAPLTSSTAAAAAVRVAAAVTPEQEKSSELDALHEVVD